VAATTKSPSRPPPSDATPSISFSRVERTRASTCDANTHAGAGSVITSSRRKEAKQRSLTGYYEIIRDSIFEPTEPDAFPLPPPLPVPRSHTSASISSKKSSAGGERRARVKARRTEASASPT